MDRLAKILIVDDNKDYLFVMETFLKRNGFDTVTAEDGQNGLDSIELEKPDLIILDIMMEGLFSGFELAKKLRTDPALKAIPVLGASGIGEELGVTFEKHHLLRKYFSQDDFFEKPVDKERLLAKIREKLGQDA